jgi:hypothetical protein
MPTLYRALLAVLLVLLAGCGTTATIAPTPVVPPSVTAPGAPPTNTGPPATPAASPPAAPGLQLVQQVVYPNVNQLIVIGLIRNPGPAPLHSLQVVAEVRDAAGATVATGGDGFLPNAVLSPTTTVPFQIVLGTGAAPAVTGTVQLHLQAQPGAGRGQSALAGLDVQGSHIGTTDLSGRVHNGTATTVLNPTILAAGYDSANHLVDVTRGYPQVNPIPPGQDSPFTLYFTRADVPITRAETWVFYQP